MKPDVIRTNARLWIYQADKKLNDEELNVVKEDLKVLLSEWNSHGKAIIADGWIEDEIFVIIAADETIQHVGGCSIDQTTRAMHETGDKITVDFFNRMNFVYLDENEETQFTSNLELPELYEKEVITDDTMFYDTLVNNYGDWEERKLKPLSQSWHRKFL